MGAIRVNFTQSNLMMIIGMLFWCWRCCMPAAKPRRRGARPAAIGRRNGAIISPSAWPSIRSARKASRFFPFIFTLFFFVLMGNLLGLVPFSFHLYQPYRGDRGAGGDGDRSGHHRGAGRARAANSSAISFPSGAPLFLAPLIVPIEIISYLSRPGEPLDPPVRQHGGRPRDVRGVRHRSW